MAISDLEIRNAWEDSLAAGFTPEQIYQGALTNFGVTREQVDRAISNTSNISNQEVQSLFQAPSSSGIVIPSTNNIASVIQELNAEISAENPTVSRVLEDGSRVVSYGDGRFAYYKPGESKYTLYDASGNLQGFESQRNVRGGIEYTTFNPKGQQIDKFVASNTPGLAGVLAPLALAAASGYALGPAGSGLFSTPTAAALGSGGMTLFQGGSAQDALRAAALAGLTAYGVEGLFGGGVGTNVGGQSALDLTLADDITNLANLGLDSNQISSIISTNYGIDPFMAADAVTSALGTTAATGGTNLVNITGTSLPATTGVSTGLGALTGTGAQTVNVTGSGTGTAGTGTVLGTTLGTALGTGLGTGAGTGTGSQTVNVTGTNAGTTAGATLGTLLGTGLGTTLGTALGTTAAPQTVEVVETKPTKPVTPVVPPIVPPKPPTETVVITDTCPAPEMQVMLADNTHKAAGDLKVGDKVLTQHEHTLVWGVHPVIYKEIIPNAKRVKVLFDDTEFIGSWDHKFFVSVDNWVTIKNLKVGDIVGSKVFKSIQDLDEGPVVFLTIEDAHTYVCQGVLSHNKTPKPPKVTPPVVIPPTTPPTTPTTSTTTTNTNNINLADLLRLLALFGGLGGMMGSGTTTGTGTVSVPPSDTMIGSTTPQFGPDYYAAVQRYYNAYMPETPRNVATPLQQWYENKFGA